MTLLFDLGNAPRRFSCIYFEGNLYKLCNIDYIFMRNNTIDLISLILFIRLLINSLFAYLLLFINIIYSLKLLILLSRIFFIHVYRATSRSEI